MNHAAFHFFPQRHSCFFKMAYWHFLLVSFLVVISIFSAPDSMAQDYNSLVSTGDDFYEKEQYHSAVQYYQVAVGLQPEHAEVNYRLAESYKAIFNYTLAAVYYEKAMLLDAISYPLAVFKRAQMLKATGNFNLAIAHFQDFLDAHGSDPSFLDSEHQKYLTQAEVEIKGCQWAMEQINSGWKDIGFKCLPEPVNSTFNDYAPAVGVHDSVITITSGRRGVKGGLLDNRYGDYFTDNLRFTKNGRWTAGSGTDRFDQNNTKFSDGAGTYNRQRTEFYFTSCYEGGAYCQLYVSNKVNGKWRTPRLLNENINVPDYDNRHPTLTPGGDTLIFASNRPGGLGGNDLWISIADGEDNWQPARPLKAPINTPFNEITPYYHKDGTLFLSSDGHQGLGGTDIFMIPGFDQGNTEIKNIGIPFNSGVDDNFFTLGETKGYLSSNRAGGSGKFDIYSFNWPGEEQSIAEFLENIEEGEQLRSRIQGYDDRNLFAARDEDQFYYDNLTAEEKAQFDRILSTRRTPDGSFDPNALAPDDFKYYRKQNIQTKAIIERLAQRRILEASGISIYDWPSYLDFFEQSDWEFYQNASAEDKAIIDRIIAARIDDREEFLKEDLDTQETRYWNGSDVEVHQRIDTKAQLLSLDSTIHDLKGLNRDAQDHLDRYPTDDGAVDIPSESVDQNVVQLTENTLLGVLNDLAATQRLFYQSLDPLQQHHIMQLALRRRVMQYNDLSSGDVQDLLQRYRLGDDLEEYRQQYSAEEAQWVEEIVEHIKSHGFRPGDQWPSPSLQAFETFSEVQKIALQSAALGKILQQKIDYTADNTEELETLKTRLNQRISPVTGLDDLSQSIENTIAAKLSDRYLSFVPRKLTSREYYYFKSLPPQDQLRIDRLSIKLAPASLFSESGELQDDFVATLSMEERQFLRSLNPEQQALSLGIITQATGQQGHHPQQTDFLNNLDDSQRAVLERLAGNYQRYIENSREPAHPDIAAFDQKNLDKLTSEELRYLETLSSEEQELLHSILRSSLDDVSQLSSQQVAFLREMGPEEQEHIDKMRFRFHDQTVSLIDWETLHNNQPAVEATVITSPRFQQQLSEADRAYLSNLPSGDRRLLEGILAKGVNSSPETFSPRERQWLDSRDPQQRQSLQNMQLVYQQLTAEASPGGETDHQIPGSSRQPGPVVYFDFDQHRLRPEAKKELEEFFKFVKLQSTPFSLYISGHTDHIGSTSYNQRLSEKRGESTARFIINLGADQSKIMVEAQGEQRPLVSNSTAYGRQLNRRVEMILENFNSIYSPSMHTVMVKPGVSLRTLAVAVGTSPENLMQWNGLEAISIRAYQPIRLPKSNVSKYRHLIYQPSLAAEHVQVLYHQVKYGENLFRLAIRYGTTVQELEQLNGIEPRELKAGQRIRVR